MGLAFKAHCFTAINGPDPRKPVAFNLSNMYTVHRWLSERNKIGIVNLKAPQRLGFLSLHAPSYFGSILLVKTYRLLRVIIVLRLDDL